MYVCHIVFHIPFAEFSFLQVKYGNTMQYRYKRYNESYTLHQRIDTVVDWLEKGTVEFATLYYHQPDRAGHQAGPYSKKVSRPFMNFIALI